MMRWTETRSREVMGMHEVETSYYKFVVILPD